MKFFAHPTVKLWFDNLIESNDKIRIYRDHQHKRMSGCHQDKYHRQPILSFVLIIEN